MMFQLVASVFDKEIYSIGKKVTPHFSLLTLVIKLSTSKSFLMISVSLNTCSTTLAPVSRVMSRVTCHE